MKLRLGFHLFSVWWYKGNKGFSVATITRRLPQDVNSLLSVQTVNGELEVDLLWCFRLNFNEKN